MKLLFIFTGGTIGSTAHGDFIGTDRVKPYLLIERYRQQYGIEAEVDVVEPYTILSENNTGETIRVLCESVASALSGGYDGIVITHGTDTLQYSAAALSYAFADAPMPICIVSSNLPIEQEGSNGLINLHGAIRFIREVRKAGVWVPYQNDGEELCIHRGTRLLESSAFSDRVSSIYDSFYGVFREDEPFEKNPTYAEEGDAMPAMGAVALPATCDEVLRLAPYPGQLLPLLPSGVKYILHASYHSGTINTASKEVRAFFDEAKKQGIVSFLTGVAPGAAYDSTRAFDELGVIPLYNIAPIAAFVKLWMWSVLHPDIPATGELLMHSLGGDIAKK